MANTYTQIHIHFVFVVQFRKGLIDAKWENELYKYITAIVQNNDHKVISINGMPDHIHLLIGLRPSQSISDLMKDVKQGSSLWINKKKLTQGKFAWQKGFGAFAISKSHLKKTIFYIKNQKEHHRNISFREEYLSFLKFHNIDFEERYVFTEPT